MGKKKNKRKNHNIYNTNTNTNLALALNETPDGNRFSYGSGNYTSNNSVLSNFKKEVTYTFNQTEFPEFVELCKMGQKRLKLHLLEQILAFGYEDVVNGDGFLYAKGSLPILLTAHMDTVHEATVIDFYEYVDKDGNHIISSPQGIGGDDRCGIYMILKLLEKGYKPSVLFCEDEEIGGIGSDKFCKTEIVEELKEMKYFIELDRANSTDAVFYDCDNEDFTSYIERMTGYKDAWGSFSDISNLSPETQVASVNLSCGYYKAHTKQEEVKIEEMLNTIEKVEILLNDVDNIEQFEYIEKLYSGYYGYGWKNSIYGYDDRYDDYNYYRNYNTKKNESVIDDMFEEETNDSKYTVRVEIVYMDSEFKDHTVVYNGTSEAACFYEFFKNYGDICYNQILDWYSTPI